MTQGHKIQHSLLFYVIGGEQRFIGKENTLAITSPYNKYKEKVFSILVSICLGLVVIEG